MKFGVDDAVLHDRSLPEAIEVVAGLGLTGIELGSGGFARRTSGAASGWRAGSVSTASSRCPACPAASRG